MSAINTVSIKFKPGAYGVFRNLENKIWYALSEYVDNAVQSYEDNKLRLKKVHNGKYKLTIDINIDWEKNFIKISDNAAGINSKNFQRAFEPANIPTDNTGLHEFGMGMKTASIWLSDVWTVRTKALGETEERYIEFDLDKVKKESKEVLKVKNSPQVRNSHYTEIVLSKLSKNAPSPQQMAKIKSHLGSIYRKFLRKGDLKLSINGEQLTYVDPEILHAPSVTNPTGKAVTWKKEIDFKMDKYKISGFIGLLNELSTTEHNGLSLFRRGRVIEGSHDEKYRPKILCGQVGSFRYKRLFGELELEGFDVSFNKGSFQGKDDVEHLMEAIKIELSNEKLNFLKQADDFRKVKPQADSVKVAKGLVTKLKNERSKSNVNANISASIKEAQNRTIVAENEKSIKKAKAINSLEETIEINGDTYLFKLEFIDVKSVKDLYSLSVSDAGKNAYTVLNKINLAHPFFSKFEQFKKDEDYAPLVSIIRALVFAEITAPSSGAKNAGAVRINFNSFLRNL